MLTRVLFAAAVAAICTVLAMPAGRGAWADASNGGVTASPKLLAIGITTHKVTADELAKGETPATPKFNTPAVAYAMVGDLRQGDVVTLSFFGAAGHEILHSTETEPSDKAKTLLLAGRLGVPVGGWDPVTYYAQVTVTRGGKTVLDRRTKPVKFP